MSCNQLIATIYTHKQFEQIINTLPEHYRDDIRQEIAVYMLDLSCEKISEIWASNSVWRLLYAVAHNMASMKNKSNPVSKMFASEDYQQAVDWVKVISSHKSSNYVATLKGRVNIDVADKIKAYIETLKNKDLRSNHQYILFNKWVEVGSCSQVAKYFDLPYVHVKNVIKEIKKDLQCLLP